MIKNPFFHYVLVLEKALTLSMHFVLKVPNLGMSRYVILCLRKQHGLEERTAYMGVCIQLLNHLFQ